MIDLLSLRKHLAAHKVLLDSDMPYPYRRSTPGGRPYHDDHGIMTSNPILRALQPWQGRERINDAYKVPVPFRRARGNAEAIWTPLLKEWPLAPGAPIKKDIYFDGEKNIEALFVLTMHTIHDAGQWSVQEAYIDGAWRECYFTRSRRVMGKRMTYYYGLRLDPHPQDLMGWFPEASLSFK